MGRIFELLGVGDDATEAEIRSEYHKRLFAMYPRAGFGVPDECIELMDAYERHSRGVGGTNCFLVCTNKEREVECRCGDIYRIQDCFVGRIECMSCSCFITVESQALEIAEGE